MKISLFNNRYDNDGQTVGLQWAEARHRLARHRVGEKDGYAIACATFNGTRSAENLATRTAIALDIEMQKGLGVIPPDPAEAFERLKSLGFQGALWTTHSHDPDLPRYRIIVPIVEVGLSDPNMVMLDPWWPAALAERLGLTDVCDPSKFGAESLFYTPRCPPHGVNYAWADSLDGPVLDPAVLRADAIRLMVAEEEEQRAALREAHRMDPRVMAVIDKFNAEHPVSVLLGRYGYRQRGRRWKSPFQSRDSAGATEIKRDASGERWVSFSESDRQAGVGMTPKRTSQCQCFGNSLDLFRHFECGGDFRLAIKKAAEMLNGRAS